MTMSRRLRSRPGVRRRRPARSRLCPDGAARGMHGRCPPGPAGSRHSPFMCWRWCPVSALLGPASAGEHMMQPQTVGVCLVRLLRVWHLCLLVCWQALQGRAVQQLRRHRTAVSMRYWPATPWIGGWPSAIRRAVNSLQRHPMRPCSSAPVAVPHQRSVRAAVWEGGGAPAQGTRVGRRSACCALALLPRAAAKPAPHTAEGLSGGVRHRLQDPTGSTCCPDDNDNRAADALRLVLELDVVSARPQPGQTAQHHRRCDCRWLCLRSGCDQGQRCRPGLSMSGR